MFSQLAIVIVALLWSGMILGISFLESWVKFTTPSLTKSVGLDVGRTVFRAFHKAQCILLILLLIIGSIIHLSLWSWLTISLVILVLLLQNFWLFPYLSRRIDLILAGNKISESKIHTLYGILEIMKLALLLGLSFTLLII